MEGEALPSFLCIASSMALKKLGRSLALHLLLMRNIDLQRIIIRYNLILFIFSNARIISTGYLKQITRKER